ncbi:DUF1993 domain-containing protein [Altererythrobacter arenosus]|uniref:DUF1993 domain-containing protein n=1 Tax=Altererythrobacter arenosus TaxID=3032592 RepID=A0ABY8FS28_9SPHN|nr:DUF1993 domain-containing protein [Altererythrobacter sp. CAU 1644]WFL77817.1 DUF1993 domain-containing protein [Altererythrobacter sp. CAU 1644]
MSLSLYEAFVPNCQQMVGALNGLIDKGEAFARDNNIAEEAMIGARLADDMWNLPWHVRSCWVHSAYVISLLPTGEFSPDFTEIADSWDGMREQVATTLDALAKVTPNDLEEMADKTIGFVLGGQRLMEFTGQNFLMSFSQPNVYFHATTFYDILRMKGVPLGKRDFMGVPRMLTPA